MKHLPKRYFWTPFNRAQVVELQRHLKLEKKSDAVEAALWIGAVLEECQEKDEARRNVPNIKSAKRRLDKIAIQAGNLARLLENESVAEELVREPGSFLKRSVDGFTDMPALMEADRQRVRSLVADLKVLSAQARRLALDDEELRRAHGLPPVWGVGKLSFSLWLWPRLFAIWTGSGQRVAKTPDGPLHRFVQFVHDVCELPEVRASTLRDAVADWEQDSHRAKVTWEPPSRRAGEV